MAGVGLRLNKFFNKKSMSSHIAGAGYSIVITIAPMLLVIVTLIIMQRLLGYTQESYYEKQLFQNTVLYIFIFSLLASAPLNAVLSRYISDVIFEETYADIMPCYYLGLLIQTLFCCLMGIPFCLHEWLSGGVRPAYVFISFCCFIDVVPLVEDIFRPVESCFPELLCDVFCMRDEFVQIGCIQMP